MRVNDGSQGSPEVSQVDRLAGPRRLSSCAQGMGHSRRLPLVPMTVRGVPLHVAQSTVLWIGLASSLFGQAVSAGPPADGDVHDLPACIRAALERAPELDGLAAGVDAAQARLAAARASRFGRAEYRQIVGAVNRARGNPIASPDTKNDFLDGLGPFIRLDLEVHVPIWTFGRIAAGVEAAEHALAAERAGGEARRAEVVLAVKRLYYGLILSRQLAGVLGESRDTLDEAIAKAQAKLDSGSSLVTELDVLRLRAGRARLARGALEAETAGAKARNALARAVGLAGDERFDIADRKLRPVEASIAPLEEYLAEGTPRRAELVALGRGVAAQEAKVHADEAAAYPAIFLATGVSFARAPNRDEQENPFAFDELNFLRPLAAVGLRWDLGFLRARAVVAESRAELERLRARQREAAGGLALEIRTAYAEVERARGALTVSEEGRKAGRGLLLLSVANYDLGIGDARDLFEALGGHAESSAEALRAVHDYDIAVAELGKAVGRELSGITY